MNVSVLGSCTESVCVLNVYAAGKTIRVTFPASIDFRYAWNRLNDALFHLGMRNVRASPLCVIFEFDERDALINYDKYVRTNYNTNDE